MEKFVLLLAFTGALVLMIFGLLWLFGSANSKEREQTRVAENAAVVEEFDVNARACAKNFNEVATSAEALLASVGDVGSANEADNQQMHALNHRTVTAARCLLTATRWLLPDKDAGATQVGQRTGMLFVPTAGGGLLPVPFASPEHQDNPVQNVVCPGEAAAPDGAVLEHVAAVDWWNATSRRLDSAGDAELGLAFVTRAEINNRGLPDHPDAYPVFSGDGATGAWLSYNPNTARVTVNPPSLADVDAYCGTLVG